MTDPLRRDPREFQRVLKLMAGRTSWQKTLIFASRGRMVGYRLGIDHYNSILFSQSLWGRALEIIKVVRAMEEDDVRPNGISYYYVCHGLANADHGHDCTGFPVNEKLPQLQHWRVAINALMAAEENGFDPPDTMYNAALTTCAIPGINKWQVALALVRKMQEEERKLHPNAVKHLERSLIDNRRPAEATRLRNYAAETNVIGYENAAEPDVFQHLPGFGSSTAALETDAQYAAEQRVLLPAAPVRSTDGVFRPRVYKQLWWKWHGVANKYRPQAALQKRQLSPKDSPTGIPGFYRL
jgi:hypothetical protein